MSNYTYENEYQYEYWTRALWRSYPLLYFILYALCWTRALWRSAPLLYFMLYAGPAPSGDLLKQEK